MDKWGLDQRSKWHLEKDWRENMFDKSILKALGFWYKEKVNPNFLKKSRNSDFF